MLELMDERPSYHLGRSGYQFKNAFCGERKEIPSLLQMNQKEIRNKSEINLEKTREKPLLLPNRISQMIKKTSYENTNENGDGGNVVVVRTW